MPKVNNMWGVPSVLTALAAAVLALMYLVGVGTQLAGAAEPTRYDVSALDEEWTNSIARDINENGTIAGQGTNPPTPETPAGQARAFLWERGDALDLGVPTDGNLSRARGINDSEDVVGEWRIQVGTQQRFKAFLYEDGQMKDLNTLIPDGTGWDLTGAQAINETGQVVGAGTKKVVTQEGVREETHAFLYEGGAVTDLGTDVLRDPYSAAWGINDSGDVVGGAGNTDLQSEAFVYRNGAAERLGNPGPFTASEAVGINNSGQAIGWSFNPGQNPPQGKAFLYDYSGDGEAKIVPLQPLPDDLYTRARDVDEAGRVVGWSRNNAAGASQQEQFSATLWAGGQVKDLNELTPPNSGWKLVDAYAINESGQIVGSGYKDGKLQAFLLQPLYDFGGFFAPVDNPPVVNAMNAGRAVPMKFSLSGDQGLDIFEDSYPSSQRVSCDAADPLDGIEETVSAGASGLTYDAASDEYTYVWKSEKAWAGTCRQLTMKLDDGTYHQANFKFRR